MPIAKKTYYLTADRSRAVGEDSPEAAYLLVREGSEIDPAQAEQYKVALAADEEKAKAEPAANKAKAAPENKAAK